MSGEATIVRRKISYAIFTSICSCGELLYATNIHIIYMFGRAKNVCLYLRQTLTRAHFVKLITNGMLLHTSSHCIFTQTHTHSQRTRRIHIHTYNMYVSYISEKHASNSCTRCLLRLLMLQWNYIISTVFST